MVVLLALFMIYNLLRSHPLSSSPVGRLEFLLCRARSNEFANIIQGDYQPRAQHVLHVLLHLALKAS